MRILKCQQLRRQMRGLRNQKMDREEVGGWVEARKNDLVIHLLIQMLIQMQ